MNKNIKVLHYAYPTSPRAEEYDHTLYGCYYIEFNGEIVRIFRDHGTETRKTVLAFFEKLNAITDEIKSLNINSI